MKTGERPNQYGTGISIHICDTCGTEFTVCPAIKDDQEGWDNCLLDECASYDPGRDADVLFMSDAEIAKEKSVVSLKMLRKRRRVQREGMPPDG